MHIAHPDEIAYLPVDVYCPCALGAVLNDTSIPRLQCQIVCGSANNQLAEERHGEMLTQRAKRNLKGAERTYWAMATAGAR